MELTLPPSPKTSPIELTEPRFGLRWRAAYAVLIACTMVCAMAMAQSESQGGGFALQRAGVVAGGKSSGGNFAIKASIGQITAAQSAGGEFELTAGIQVPSSTPPNNLFKNGFEDP